MKASVDISLYPLADDYIPAIKEFIERISDYPEVSIVRGDLSTQLFGEFEAIMQLLRIEVERSWATHGKGVFVMKFLMDDLRGLASD